MKLFSSLRYRKVSTPTILQMEAVECGAVALGIILAYHGCWIPLETLRQACGVSRDGSRADYIYQAAEKYGMKVNAYRLEPENVKDYHLPAIIHWDFNHFVVLDRVTPKKVYINDPANGPRAISWEEFDESFTGILLELKPGPQFHKQGHKPRALPSLLRRLRYSKAAVFYIVMVTLALAVPGIMMPGLTKIFIDNVLVQQLQNWLMPVLLGLLIVALSSGILNWLQQYLLMRLETKLALVNSSEFFWHLLHLPLVFFSQRYVGDIYRRLESSDAIANLVSQQFGTNIVNILLMIIYLVIMALLSFPLTVVAVLISSLNVVALLLINKKHADESHRQTKTMNQMLSTAIGGLQMIETYKASGSENDFFKKFSGQHAKYLQTMQRLSLIGGTLSILPSVFNALANVAILGLGGWFVIQGKMSIGTIIAFQMLYARFNQPLDMLVMLAGQLQEIIADLIRIQDVMQHDKAPRYSAVEQTVFVPEQKLIGHVVFKDVTFGYSPLAEPLLRDFSLEIHPGKRVALVGASGSGKSTIAKLLAGHYKPWSGSILLDGADLDHIPNAVRTRSIAVVDQDIMLFEGTLKENLTLWDYTIKDDEIIAASKAALIHDVVSEQRLAGYESMLTEGGANFSGGQRQRLEIARALIQKPSILILDEATSALDAKMEKIIDIHIRQLGCTVLVISHRLSSIRDSDEIIVLEQGKVIERGRHQDLLAKAGSYSQLVAKEA